MPEEGHEVTKSPSYKVRWIFGPYDMDTQSVLAVSIYCAHCGEPHKRNSWRFYKPMNAVSAIELMRGIHGLQPWVTETLEQVAE